MKNVTSLNVSQIKSLIKYKFNLQASGQKVRPIFIEGHRGIGKTQIVNQVASELSQAIGKNVKVLHLDLQFKERPDFSGLSYVENGRTKEATPEFLPTDDSYGIIFLDEANRVEDRSMRSGLLTLLEERRINNVFLGKNWYIVLAGNPDMGDESDLYEGIVQFDSALSDRVSRVFYKPNHVDSIAYLDKKYPGHPLVNFLKSNNSMLGLDGRGVSPRTWEYAMIATPEFNLIDSETLPIILESELGLEAANTVIGWVSANDVPSFESIVLGNKESLEFVKKNRHRMDLISAYNNQLIAEFKEICAKKQKNADKRILGMDKYFALITDEQRTAVLVTMKDHGDDVFARFCEKFVFGKNREGILESILVHKAAG